MEKYTNPSKIAINGGSNSGFLATLQRARERVGEGEGEREREKEPTPSSLQSVNPPALRACTLQLFLVTL